MQTENISSSWSLQQAHRAQGKTGQNFATQMASSGLSAQPGDGVRSGGQLLSDDMARALASYGMAGK